MRGRLASAQIEPVNPEASAAERHVAQIEPYLAPRIAGPNDADEAVRRSLRPVRPPAVRLDIVERQSCPCVHEFPETGGTPVATEGPDYLFLRNGLRRKLSRGRRSRKGAARQRCGDERDQYDGHSGLELRVTARHAAALSIGRSEPELEPARSSVEEHEPAAPGHAEEALDKRNRQFLNSDGRAPIPLFRAPERVGDVTRSRQRVVP
jgi:hypothetical protein